LTEPRPLEELPAALAALSSQVVEGGREITRLSVDRWFRRFGEADMLALAEVRLGWHLFVEKRNASTWFGFIPLATNRLTALEANIAVQARPASVPPVVDGVPELRLELPSFFWLDASPEDIRRYAPAGGLGDAENTLLLRLGEQRQDILGVHLDPPSQVAARLRFSPGGVPGADEPSVALASYVALVDTFSAWQSAGMPSQPDSAVTLPDAAGKTVADVIRRVRDAFVACRVELGAAPTFPALPVTSSWRVDGCSADLVLRLDVNGDLAEKLAALRFIALLHIAQRGDDALRVTVGPGELSVSDGVVDAVLDDFAGAMGRPALAAAIWIDTPYPHLHVASIPPFIESARGRSRALHLERVGAELTLLVDMCGTLEGQAARVLVVANFVVDETVTPPTVDIKVPANGGPPVTRLMSPWAHPSQAFIPKERATPIFVLLDNLLRWRKLLF
jgi:hypothetical protein